MGMIKLNSSTIDLNQMFYNGNEVKVFRQSGYILTINGFTVYYTAILQEKTVINGTTYYIWAKVSEGTPTEFYATTTPTPYNGLYPQSATKSGSSWSLSSQSTLVFIGTIGYEYMFSKLQVKIDRIHSIVFNTTSSDKKYIPFGTIASRSNIINGLLYNGNTTTQTVEQAINTISSLASYTNTAIIGWGYYYKRPTSLSLELYKTTKPQETARNINELIHAECRFISTINLTKLNYNQTSINLGDQTYLRTVKNVSTSYAGGAYTIKMGKYGSQYKSDEYSFTTNLINRSDLPSSAKLCFAWKLTWPYFPSGISATASIGNQNITLNAGETTKSGVAEIPGAYHAPSLTPFFTVTSSNQYLYNNNWEFVLELAPFVVS